MEKETPASYLIELTQFCNAKGDWSLETFGPTDETNGPNHETITEHILSEIEEVRRDPTDLTEWIDIMLLAMDGYFRSGGRNLGRDLAAKQNTNYSRKWPDPATRKAGTITEHIKYDPDKLCEVCGAMVEDRYGCEQCGRLFGACCNSQDDDLCVQCV